MMKLTNVRHIKISDVFEVHTDEGNYILTIAMSPLTDKEPIMSVITIESEKVSDETEQHVIELFLSARENNNTQ